MAALGQRRKAAACLRQLGIDVAIPGADAKCFQTVDETSTEDALYSR